MSGAAVRQYVDEAVGFTPALAGHGAAPRRIRVARTPLTCRIAAQVLSELGLPEEAESSYRFVNVHNPRCPLSFDRAQGRWTCAEPLEDHPVWGINWAGAVLVCSHLGARLPTQAEWECFASGNDPARRYPWGNAEPSHALANYDEHYGATTPVGRFPASALGLLDLAGNVGEWCQDHPPADAAGRAAFERVVKGGAWSKDARYLAIGASRSKWARLGTTTIGFRPVWDDRSTAVTSP